MKRIFLLILLSVFLALNTAPVFAQDPPKNPLCDPKNLQNQILPCETVQKVGGADLPTSALRESIIPSAINILLAFGGSMSLIVFTYAGIMLIIAQGNEEEITKFKNILIWSIVGLLFIITSYGLVRGILQLVFK